MAGFAATNDALKLRPNRCEAVNSIVDAIGNTPIVQVHRCLPDLPGIEIFAKLEGFNPGGTAADRRAWATLHAARSRGSLEPGAPLVARADGDAAISFALTGAAMRHPVRHVSSRHARPDPIPRALGAETIAAVEAPASLFCVEDISAPSVPDAHTTAREIYDQMCGRLTHLVSSFASGGVLEGTVRGLKRHASEVQCLGVAFDGAPEAQALEALVDGTVRIPEAAARMWAGRAARGDGLSIGLASGAALAAAVDLAQSLVARGETGMIVCLFPDRNRIEGAAGPLAPPSVW